MPTYPSSLPVYKLDNYSFEISPEVVRTQYHTGRARQRKHFEKRDDVFNVTLSLTNAELDTFENFVTSDLENGSLTYTGPYYTSDVQYSGTLEIIRGEYSFRLVPPDRWEVSFRMELKDRDMTEEDNIYALINSLSTFENAYNIFDALEDMVNNNNL